MVGEKTGSVIVTGSTGGIGRAVVHSLLRDGFEVVATGRDRDALEAEYGGNARVMTYATGLATEEEAAALVKAAFDNGGPVRGLVHCAGFDKLAPLYLNKRTDTEALFAIHVFAAMDLCKQLAKRGRAAEGCSIVLISSLAAHEGAKGHTAYAAAKGALEGFLPSAACELAERGIRINAVTLGIVETEMSAGYIDRMDGEQKERLFGGYPLGLGTPRDAAEAVAFLVSDKSKWITGQSLVLDGGHLSRA